MTRPHLRYSDARPDVAAPDWFDGVLKAAPDEAQRALAIAAAIEGVLRPVALAETQDDEL